MIFCLQVNVIFRLIILVVELILMKIRHIHICIDDESYFALLSLQSKTGLSKTKVIENLLKEGDRKS